MKCLPLITGCLAALLCGAWAFGQDDPNAAAASPPAASAASAASPADGPTADIRFQFDGTPYTQVVRRFSQVVGKPLVGDLNIPGELTFFDSEPYTRAQALDTLNLLLAMRGYTLMETERFLRLVKLEDVGKLPLPIMRGLDQAEREPDSKIVTVVLPVNYIEAEAAAKTFVPMVSSFGTITPLARGKGIVITDQLGNIRRVRDLLELMDTGAMVQMQMATIVLEQASAQTVAKIVNDLLGGKSQVVLNPKTKKPMRVGPDPGESIQAIADERTNAVVIMGPTDRLAMAEQLVAQLDATRGPVEGDMRVFALDNANAEALAETVAAALPGKRDNRGRPLPDAARIVADATTNRLIVAAPVDQMASVAKLIEQLDQASEQAASVRIFRLQAADAGTLASVVRQSVTRRDERGRASTSINVSADARTNSLIVSGDAADLQTVAALLEQLDTDQPQAEAREFRVVQLDQGEAREVARALTNLFFEQVGRGEPQRVRIESDRQSNSLMIAAPPDDWPTIQKLLTELNQGGAGADGPAVRLFTLESADAQQLARVLIESLSRRDEWGRVRHTLSVVPDSRTNTLVVSADAEYMAEVERLVEQLDAGAATEPRQVRVFSLKAGDAWEVSRSLTQALRGATDGEVSVQPDRGTNSLIISALESDWPKVTGVIEQLNTAVTASGQPTARILKVQHTSASELAETLRNMYDRRDWRARYERPVVISPGADNSLLVFAPQEEQQQIAELLDTMDANTGVDTQREVRILALESGDARALANALGRALDGVAQAPVEVQADRSTNALIIAAARADWPTITQLVEELNETVGDAGQPATRRLELEHAKAADLAPTLQNMYDRRDWSARYERPVVVSASESDNSLLVFAMQAEQQAIGELVASMDVERTGEARREVRVFSLKSGDARQVASALSRTLGQTTRGAVEIEADRGANALIVAAGAEDWPQIEKVIEQINASVAATNEPITRTIKLDHADAQEARQTLTTMYRGRDWLVQRERPVVISAGADNNLLIYAPQDEQQQIAGLLDALDAEPNAAARREVRVLALESGDAREVGSALSRALEGTTDAPVEIQPDRSTNALIIAASPADWPTVSELVTQLNESVGDARQPATRRVALEHARAGELARTVQQMYDRRDWRARYERPVTVTANDVDNSLIVFALEAEQQAIADLVQSLDTEPAPGAERQVRVFSLKSGDAREVARSLSRTLPETTGGAVEIEADRGTNSLIIAAGADDWESIEAVIEQINASVAATTQPVTRTVKLEHADAADLERTLRNMYDRRDWSDRSERQVIFSSSDRDNTLLIYAPQDEQDAISQIIESVDVPEDDAGTLMRLIHLESAKAEDMVEALRGMEPDRDVVIRAHEPSNSLLLRAPVAKQAALEELIGSLDQSTLDQSRETRIVPLKHASGAQLASVLSQLQTEGGSSRDRWSPWRRGGSSSGETDRVIITAGPGDRTLVISAPRGRIEALASLAESLDQPEAAEGREVRTYALESGKAEELAGSLQRLFATRDRTGPEPPRFEADAAANQLIVAAAAAQFEEIDKVIEQVESAQPDPTQTRTYKLRFAEAVDLVDVLQSMLAEADDRSPRNRWVRRLDPGAATVRVAAVEATNTLVVQAPLSKLSMADELIRTFDREEAGSQIVIQSVQLSNAQAVTMADAVTAVVEARSQTARGRPGAPAQDADAVTVTAETNSNSVLVRGPADRVAEVVEMIARLDEKSTSSSVQMRVYPLSNADAATLSGSVEKLFRDALQQAQTRRAGARGRAAPVIPFSVAADTRTNSLVVSTTPAHFAVVEQLLEMLDQAPDAPDRDVRYLWLENANAFEVAGTLQALYVDRKGPDRPVIQPDYFVNAVTIVANDADLEQMEPIIAKLDKAAATSAVNVRVIPLTNARASRMADVLERLYPEMSGTRVIVEQGDRADDQDGGEVIEVYPSPLFAQPGDGNDPAPAPDDPNASGDAGPTAADPPRPAELAGPQPVTILVDEKVNALIVSGPRKDLDAIESLVFDFTYGVQSAEDEFRIFRLEHADPSAVAAMLEALFNPREKPPEPARPDRDEQREDREGRNGGRERQRQQPAPPKQVISVVADARNRNVLVRARSTHLDVIEQLIAQIDQVPRVVSEVRVFRLQNADAAQVVATLNELLESGASDEARGRTQRDRARRVEQVVEVVTDGRTEQVDLKTLVGVSANEKANSIVVAAPGEVMAVLEPIIHELDQSAAAAGEPVVRLYPVEQGDPIAMVEALREVFAAEPRANELPVIVTADVEAGRLIVSASSDTQPLVARVIEDLTAARGDEGATVRVYRLTHAEARQAATALTETMGEGAGGGRRGRGRAAPAAGLRISPDRSSNSLLVRGTDDEHERIAALLADLDKPAVESMPVRMVPLNHADADAVARVLRNVFVPRGAGGAVQQVVIESDAKARMVLVRADDATFARVKELAQNVDSTSVGRDAAPMILPLEHAQASSVAAAVSQAFAPRRGQRVEPDDLVTVVAEPDSNSLIVTASAENADRVRSLIDRLDTENAGGMRTEFILLRNARAGDLAQVLGAAAANATRGQRNSRPVVVSAEESSNALVFNGPANELNTLMTMAMQLDQASTGATTGVYIVPLETSDAGGVAQTVRDLYEQQRRTIGRGEQLDPLAVAADQRANALILVTSKSMHEQVNQWVQQVERMKPARGTPRIIPIEHADPAEVDSAIREVFGGGTDAAPVGGGRRGRANPRANPGGGGGGGSGRVETTVLAKQRAILIEAGEEDFQAIRQLAAALDASAAENRPELKVFQLEHATNTRLAQALGQTYRASNDQAPPEQRVTVTALPNSQAVVVAAPRNKLEEVSALITQLDAEQIAAQPQFRVYQLEHATPSKVLPLLRQMLASVQALSGEIVNVQADDRTRSIIITTRQQVFDEIDKAIDALDRAPAFESADVRIVTVTKADAARLAQVLNQMLTPQPGGRLSPEARALQEQVRRLRISAGDDRPLPELDLTKPIKIVSDPLAAGQAGSNQLLISSTPDNLTALAALVEVMDRVPLADEARVKLMHLSRADAGSVAATLREVFRQGRTLAGAPGTPTEGRAAPAQPTGRALVSPLNVAIDPRTNTLVVSGTVESIRLAERIVNDLDREQDEATTDLRLFTLKHADADRLASVLRAVFAEGAPAPGAEGVRTQVTRLRTVLEGQGVKTSDIAKVRPALTIQADPSTQMLVVSARADVMPLIADVVATMDVPGPRERSGVRVYPLEHAEASRVRQVITDLYAGQRPGDPAIRAEDIPTVTVDTRTNALVIVASDKTFGVIDALLKSLDTEQELALRDIRLVPLDNADAATLAPILQRMLDARVERQEALGVADAEALRVILAADPRSNAIIVGGGADGYELVRRLAEKLDTADPALQGRVRLVALDQANAGSVAATLTNLFNQRYAQAATPEVARQRPIVLPDLRTNSLLIVSNADDAKIIDGLLEQIDVERRDPTVVIEVIPLEHNDAGVVGPTIQRLFASRLVSMTPQGEPPNPQDRVDVATDPLANALVISASRENIALVRALLAKVDVEPPTETGVVKLYTLKNADAQRVSTMLQGLVSQGLYKPGTIGAQNDPLRRARELVSIVADVRTNTLIVSASKENFAVINQIIEQVDGLDDADALSDVRLYPLEHADAARLAPVLSRMFDAKRQAEIAAGASGRSLPTTVTADARTNTLIVTGSREAFGAVEAMLERLDSGEGFAAGQFRVFTLEQSTAASLEPLLARLFANRPQRDGPNDPITVIADAKTNSLLVSASPADMPLVASLVERLDKPQGQTATQVFPMADGDVAAAAQALRTLFQNQQGEPGVAISIDERMNALIVTGGEADLKRAADIVSKLDTRALTKVTEIRVLALKNADAEGLSQLLMDALTEQPQGGVDLTPNRQTVLQFVSQSDDGDKLVASALQQAILITPDRRTNTLIVRAPAENMPLLKQIIHTMDSAAPRMAEVRVFRLTNADALQMADVLIDLFRLEAGPQTTSERAVSYTLVDPAQAGDTDPAPRPGQPSATVGAADQYALSVTVDSRTNSLLIGGTRGYVELCGRIIEELDSSPAQQRKTTVYRLRNSQAVDIEASLRSFLDQERQRIVDTLGEDRIGAAQRLLEREVAVVAEQRTNALLVSASPRYYEQIIAIVQQLDQPPPQVLIQVLLAEVTLDDDTDLGFEWTLDAEVGDLGDLVTGTDFGVSTAQSTFGGFSATVTGGDLSFMFRALQSQGRLEVLSRPQILASDNQPASINVGQSVPFITNSRITDNGDTINTIQYQDVGVILEVTPRINEDGFVQMDVRPEISSIADSTVPISETVNATIFNQRTAETTISVKDGHTIVIGGLINTTDSLRENKVPLLGDIPLAGALFRSTSDSRERTELLIVLTPHVVRDLDDADMYTDEAISEIELLEPDPEDTFKRRVLEPLNRGPGANAAQPPARTKVIDLTVTDQPEPADQNPDDDDQPE